GVQRPEQPARVDLRGERQRLAPRARRGRDLRPLRTRKGRAREHRRRADGDGRTRGGARRRARRRVLGLGAEVSPAGPARYHGGFMSAASRSDRLRALLAERIVVLDGATGTYIQGRELTARDFGGPEYEGCNEHLVLTRPDVIRDMHEGYLAAGADIVETDTCGAARLGIDEGAARAGRSVPVVLSVSIETMGTMLAGQSIEAVYVSVAHRDLLAMGLNCATGPDFMTDHLRTLAAISRFPVSCFPNAGLPDEEGRYNETPESLVTKVERFCAEGWVNIIGGCCGTTAEHIRLLAELARRHRPRSAAPVRRTIVSGIEVLPIDDDRRPVVVGERTNVIGSRKFKELVGG